jgi:hypothetical protein
MSRFRLFRKPITRHHLAYLTGFMVWLALVFLLPSEWSEFVGNLGLVIWGGLYMLWAMDTREPTPKWGSFARMPLEPFQISESLQAEDIDRWILDRAQLLLTLHTTGTKRLKRDDWMLLSGVLIVRKVRPHSIVPSDTEVLAILKLLEIEGDTADLPMLKFWVNQVTYLWANEKGPVAEAAEACLPVLQARLNRETHGAMLLRPSVRSDAPDELLRPAAGSAETDPSTLLRAAEDDAH